MITDVILKLNNYRPQKGCWLSHTVLDHARRKCFVVRIRVGEGFWRRGAETHSAVNWKDRIIEICEGSWSYVAGSIGRAPEKVVGTVTPKESPEQRQAEWHFSTGDELLINWGSSTPSSGLSFCLKSQSSDSSVMLLRGRKVQYQDKIAKSVAECTDKETKSKLAEDEKEVDNGFVTLVRFTEQNPTGRATALLNWKLLVLELLPEEDAILVLLLCVSILGTVSEMSKEDVGILHLIYILGYWNVNKVMAQHKDDSITRQPVSNYSPVEGGDMLYKRGKLVLPANRRSLMLLHFMCNLQSYFVKLKDNHTEKVVGTVTPKESPEQRQAEWHFSTGDELLINWGSSMPSSQKRNQQEEQQPLVLLLCVSILRTVSEMSKEDVGIFHLIYILGYWNVNKVMAQHEDDSITRQPASNYSPVEGGGMLYKRGKPVLPANRRSLMLLPFICNLQSYFVKLKDDR
ncbi:hypothetical protein CRYUN_Cryun09bG0177400 [Craigia yunnanensis]